VWYGPALEMLEHESHWRIVGEAAILILETEVRRVEVDGHGRRLALVLAQDVLAVAHERFIEPGLFCNLLWSIVRRTALDGDGDWTWWVATARGLSGTRNLGGRHGRDVGGCMNRFVWMRTWSRYCLAVDRWRPHIASGLVVWFEWYEWCERCEWYGVMCYGPRAHNSQVSRSSSIVVKIVGVVRGCANGY
jgi:hypothetical protein